MPSLSAFWRIEPTERFICLLILLTGVRAFECARSALTSCLVNRRRAAFFVLFAICTLLIEISQRHSRAPDCPPAVWTACYGCTSLQVIRWITVNKQRKR